MVRNYTCNHCDTLVSKSIINVGDLINHRIYAYKCTACGNITIFTNGKSNIGGELTNGDQVYPAIDKRKSLPNKYIPANIYSDYQEANLTLSVSPKASASLSRRCLEQILIDQGIKKNKLYKMIESYINENNLQSDIVDEFELLREFGNMGAHPKYNEAGEIVEVEESEAEFILTIIENLLDYCFIAKANRKEKIAKLNLKINSTKNKTPSQQ
jgi:hypothetical protein